MKLTLNQATFGTSIILVLTALVLFAFMSSRPVEASAPSGLPATMASSSNPIVPQSSTVIIATSSCASRIISTASTSLMLGFGDKVPTATFGVYQAASTTVVYDSGQYGCGSIRAISYPAGQITVMDDR